MGFWERMEEVINQGIHSSREVLGKAKDKAKELGEKGVLKFEIMQLEKQAEAQLAQLGSRVYEKLVIRDQTTVSKETVKNLLQDIIDLKQRIENKEDALKQLDEKKAAP